MATGSRACAGAVERLHVHPPFARERHAVRMGTCWVEIHAGIEREVGGWAPPPSPVAVILHVLAQITPGVDGARALRVRPYGGSAAN